MRRKSHWSRLERLGHNLAINPILPHQEKISNPEILPDEWKAWTPNQAPQILRPIPRDKPPKHLTLKMNRGQVLSGDSNGNPLQYSYWEIPSMEEPGRLQSMGSRRVGHDWVTSLSLFTFMHWRRKWQPTPVFLPGESQGRGSLVGCRLWGHTELDMTEAT